VHAMSVRTGDGRECEGPDARDLLLTLPHPIPTSIPADVRRLDEDDSG